MILCNVKIKLEGVLRVPHREHSSERSRGLSSGGAFDYSSLNWSKTKKKAILKFCYFIGKNLRFLTKWFLKKIGPNLRKSQIYFWISKIEVKFGFFSKMVTTSWKITKKTEENIWSKILLYAKRNKLHSFEEFTVSE